MENSGLVELIKVLTNKELKDFMLFLESPYHNRGRYRKEAQTLFKFLIKYAPNFESEKIGKEKAYRLIFPDELFVEGRIEKVMVELSKSIRMFLLTEHYFREENHLAAQTDFGQILKDRRLVQRAFNQVRAVLDDLKQDMFKNAQDYDRLYKASILAYSIETEKNTWKEDFNIGKTLRFLDLYYYGSRLTLLNHYLLLSKFARVNHEIDLPKEKQIDLLFEVAAEESPSIFVARKIFNLYSEGDPTPASFEVLLSLLRRYEPDIDAENLKFFFSYLRNYCTALLTMGHQHLWPALHEIQRDNLDKGYFYYQDAIPPGAFFSIANTALRVAKLDWAFAFIEAHKYKILGDNATQDYYRLVYANYLFAKGAYEETLDYIPPASPNMDFHLWARRLELKTYFELDSDLLSYKIDAFKMYLSRSRQKILSENTYEVNVNFVNILNQMFQSKPGDSRRGETIYKRIQEKKQLHEKDWLIEKVKKLK